MSVQVRPLGLGLSVVAVIGLAVGISRSVSTSSVAADTLRATDTLKWFRGNLHTHSRWSDGDDYPEMIALWYIEHGYDFLAFTDHNLLANKDKWVNIDQPKLGKVAYDKLKARFPNDWIEERVRDGSAEIRLKRFDEVFAKLNQRGKFLLIQGEEISDVFDRRPIHLNASNVVENIRPASGTSVTDVIQNNVDALVAQRERTRQAMMIHLNHPNFGWGITAEDLAPIRGENYFEVYNGHPGVNNSGDDVHASTERIWDIINARRLTEFNLPLLYGLANDDGHSYHNIPSRASEPGRGWVMVLAADLDPSALIHAMENGRFYASSGVTLEQVTMTAKSLEVQIRPDADATYTIDFIGTRKGFDPTSSPVVDKSGKDLPVTRSYSSDIGKVFKSQTGTTASYQFAGDELYVRARITSSRLHPNPSEVGEFERAWTQPVRP